MTRQILLGTAAALLIAVPASALTMNVIDDGRFIEASAMAGRDRDGNSDSAAGPVFTSEVSAHAMALDDVELQSGDANSEFGYGAWADANARQHSEIGALSISGEGSANASGSHGIPAWQLSLGDAEVGFGGFQANAESSIKILFSIDEAAEFYLSGFISAGIEQALGPVRNDAGSSASVFFGSEDDESTIFRREVFEDGLKFEESGIIGPGDYVFAIQARANVFGDDFENSIFGDSDETHPDADYTSGSRFGGNLQLSPLDQPIPEPVTTSLIGMSLGALVLRTSRRRHA